MPQSKRVASSLVRRPAADPVVWWERVLQWARPYRLLLQGGAGGLAVLVVCGIVWTAYWGQQRRQGLEELRHGILAIQGGHPGDAVSHLEQAVSTLPVGVARQLALVFLGKAYLGQEQLDAAKHAYEQVLLTSSEEESALPQLAALELGRVAERQGDLPHARQYYEQAAVLEGPLKAEATLATAHVLAVTADDSAASSYYAKFLEEYPSSPLVEVVRQKVE